VLRRGRARLAALLQADADGDTAVTQGEGVGVTLRTVAEDGHLLCADQGQVSIAVVENLGHWLLRTREGTDDVAVCCIRPTGGRQDGGTGRRLKTCAG